MFADEYVEICRIDVARSEKFKFKHLKSEAIVLKVSIINDDRYNHLIENPKANPDIKKQKVRKKKG